MAVRDVVQAAAGVGGGGEYIEDVFSTYLYTGNSSTQTITNGVDLAGEGGMVWLKSRSNVQSHVIADTERGVNKVLFTESTSSQVSTTSVTSFNSNGFSLGNYSVANYSTFTYASWTFRKAPKFFDVVTYTGNGVTGRSITHSLGSVPGCIIVKRTDSSSAGDWTVYHRSLSSNTILYLNATLSEQSGGQYVFGDNTNIITPTSSDFTVSAGAGYANVNGATYVAYLFAHDAGGFGDDGLQNVISCGSYTGNGVAGLSVTLGYEPQWIMIKRSNSTGDWEMIDSMRGIVSGGTDPFLRANTSGQEFNVYDYASLTATGFTLSNDANVNTSGGTYIYIAIRRGPMKTPESGTEVFAPVATSGSTGTTHNIGFPLDLQMSNYRTGSFTYVSDRLRGVDSTTNETAYPFLKTDSTSAEATSVAFTRNVNNTSFQTPSFLTGLTQIYWNFRRAPGFFDVVAYTGTGVARTVNHNLAAVPELMIVKKRNAVEDWGVYTAATGNTGSLRLNTTGSFIVQSVVWNNTTPTSSVFTVGTNSMVNANADTYVAYLFATLPGVSKVGSYTGTGATQTINCGFSAGARFVLIKRTDSTGDWYVWDSARGIVAGNDPYLLLNSTAAEVTTTDYIDPVASGFEISSTAPAAINASGGSYIFLAIA